jgi:hypothetical protein
MISNLSQQPPLNNDHPSTATQHLYKVCLK